MVKLLVLYHNPADAAAFDNHYAQVHIPLGRKIPGVQSFTVNADAVTSPAGESPYHLVAELTFNSAEELQAALASPEGQEAVADLANFAQAGVTILTFPVRDA